MVEKIASTSEPGGEAGSQPSAGARVSDAAWPHLVAGFAALLLFGGAMAAWAATIQLAGAVIAPGTVVVETNVKKVQHAAVGIVGEIFVRDGDKVKAGDLLMRLDDTIMRANVGIVTGQLNQLAIRKARLVAERDNLSAIEVPGDLARQATDPAVQETIAGELALFQSRQAARAGQKQQLTERIVQLKQEIQGLTSQQEAKGTEIALIEQELIGLVELFKKELVPSIRIASLKRESARLGGEQGQLIASIAQARGKIAEIELQIIQLDQDLKAEVTRDMRDVQAKEAEYIERRVAAEDTLKRSDIRSPQTGIVHQMSVHTIGGVVSQSEPIMLIVPEGDGLVIEAKVAPQDIDHVQTGQSAFVRFPNFSQYTTPEFAGIVDRVAADLTREAQTGLTYYVTRIVLKDAETAKSGALKLKAGMPAEVHIRTAERTAVSYLFKPLADQVARAFREP